MDDIKQAENKQSFTQTIIDGWVDIKDISSNLKYTSIYVSTSQTKDWKETIKTTLQTASNLGQIPPLLKNDLQLKIYHWGKKLSTVIKNMELTNTLHWSVIIGCENYKNYFSFELCTDEQTNKIFLKSRIYDENRILKENLKKKWIYHGILVNTSINDLIEYSIKLVENHGYYTPLFNNCQTFVKCFIDTLVYNGYFKGVPSKNEKVLFFKDPVFGYKIFNENGNKINKALVHDTTHAQTKKATKGLIRGISQSSAVSTAVAATTATGIVGGLAIGVILGFGSFVGTELLVESADGVIVLFHGNKQYQVKPDWKNDKK